MLCLVPTPTHPSLLSFCLCLCFSRSCPTFSRRPPGPFSGGSASGSPFPKYQWAEVCVPTEPHGLVFQDMGFTVSEHSFWDAKHLCMDPNMLLDVVEVEGPCSEASPLT